MTDPVEVVAALLGGAALLAVIGWLTPLPRLATALTVLLFGAAAHHRPPVRRRPRPRSRSGGRPWWRVDCWLSPAEGR